MDGLCLPIHWDLLTCSSHVHSIDGHLIEHRLSKLVSIVFKVASFIVVARSILTTGMGHTRRRTLLGAIFQVGRRIVGGIQGDFHLVFLYSRASQQTRLLLLVGQTGDVDGQLE